MREQYTRRFRLKLNQLFWIIVWWTLLGALDALGAYSLSAGWSVRDAGVVRFVLFNTLSAFFSSIISGGFLVFFLRDRFTMKSFGFALLISSFVISVLNFGIFLLTHGILLSIRYGQNGLDPEVLARSTFLFDRPFYVKILIFWSIVAFITTIALHVNEKYGQGVLIKMLLGHYHRPREEERIFMFVDIKGSTAIAEQLGHVQFFNFLNDFFRDVTNPIVDTSGEIYQYVGDEIVVSWTMKDGLQNFNCIRCFFRMQELILRRSGFYRDKYGVAPEFKAGLHCGVVTTGEIGVIKKDIVFSGDTMNTTARIQAVCNKFRVRMLLSKNLLENLELPPLQYHPKRVGTFELKGKKQLVELYTFEEAMEPKYVGDGGISAT